MAWAVLLHQQCGNHLNLMALNDLGSFEIVLMVAIPGGEPGTSGL